MCRIIEEKVRFTMIFTRHCMDMFTALEVFSQRFNMRGVSEGVARAWVTQMVGVVIFCSSKGVAHRDLKLDNVLVDVNGNVVVSDFELGCMLPDGVADEVNCDIIGTPMYIPPEVVREKVSASEVLGERVWWRREWWRKAPSRTPSDAQQRLPPPFHLLLLH